MNQNIEAIWQETILDITAPAALWQLGAILLAVLIAFLIRGMIRNYVMQNAPEDWKLAIGGINRVLFPLSTLIILQINKLILATWQHTSMLHLASTLLMAMAVIRLFVYAIRYISPGGLLKSLENSISATIWVLLALHLSGLLPEITQTLQDVQFKIGKSELNLLIIFQALLTILTTIFVAMWFSRMIENKVMHATHIRMNMRVVLSKVLRVALLFIALLVGLSTVGLDLTLLSVFGGALGVGLGFGLQRIASNYVSGFILLLDNSMQIGDIITVDDKHYGEITDLRTRYLVLKKLDGTQVIVPNESLIINPVINHSFTDRNTRVVLEIQVAYDSNLEKVLAIMLQTALNHPRILKIPAPTSGVIAFADSGISLMLTVWIVDPENGQLLLKSELFLDLWRSFKEHNISIPYPQREIRIHGNLSANIENLSPINITEGQVSK